MTFDRFDHDELLAFIEGELPPEAAARLEQALAESPRVAMQVERMRRDRELLRSDRDAALPRDFLTGSARSSSAPGEIESRLARPMLMESLIDPDDFSDSHAASSARPGAMRRKHKRQRLHRRLTRLAAAAVVMLLIGSGAWALLRTVNVADRGLSSKPQVAISDRSVPVPAAVGEGRAVKPWPPGAIVHHAPMLDVVPIDSPQDETDEVARVASSEKTDAAAEAMLIIRTPDVAHYEAALARLVAEVDQRIALVQNFSYREASELAEAWMRSEAGRAERRAEDSARAATGAAAERRHADTGDRLRRIADQARRQMDQVRGGGGPGDVEQSRQLSGPREHAPAHPVQLEYSQRGATHTLAVPAARLHDLLAALNHAGEGEVLLTLLPDAADESEQAADEGESRSEVWLTQRRELEQWFSRLRSMDEEAMIHLPIRLDRSPARPRAFP